jgi:hypothetical protein
MQINLKSNITNTPQPPPHVPLLPYAHGVGWGGVGGYSLCSSCTFTCMQQIIYYIYQLEQILNQALAKQKGLRPP